MKSKKNKMTNKERDRQLNHIFQALYELSQELRMVRGLFENYMIWKKDVKKGTGSPHVTVDEVLVEYKDRKAKKAERKAIPKSSRLVSIIHCLR